MFVNHGRGPPTPRRLAHLARIYAQSDVWPPLVFSAWVLTCNLPRWYAEDLEHVPALAELKNLPVPPLELLVRLKYIFHCALLTLLRKLQATGRSISRRGRFSLDGRTLPVFHTSRLSPSGSSKSKKSCVRSVTSNSLSVSLYLAIWSPTSESLCP